MDAYVYDNIFCFYILISLLCLHVYVTCILYYNSADIVYNNA